MRIEEKKPDRMVIELLRHLFVSFSLVKKELLKLFASIK